MNRAQRLEREEQEAEDYAAAILDGLRHDWAALNADIIGRFSLTALVRIKHRAWRIVQERQREGERAYERGEDHP